MSISSRSQTCTIYTPTATSDGGYASDSYSTTGTEYFCRVVETSARERIATGKIDDATTAVVELADEVVVPAGAVLRVNGLNYRVKGITRRPLQRCNQYAVEWLAQPYTGIPA